MYKRNDQFFETSYAARTDVWSGLQHRDEAFERWLASMGVSPGVMLDIGCGVARHAKTACAQGWQYVGLDKATSCLRQARDNIIGLNAQLVTGDVLRVPLNTTFAALLDFACFTHLQKRESSVYLKSINKLSQPGAHFLLCVWSVESTEAYGVQFGNTARDCVVGPYGGVYTRLFGIDDIEQVFGCDWKITGSEIVSLKLDPVIGLKHLFISMRKR